MITCSNCGAGIPDDFAFCGQCGAPRPDDIDHDQIIEFEDKEQETVGPIPTTEPEVLPQPDPIPYQDYPTPTPVQSTRKGGNTCLWFVLGCLFLILVLLCVLIIVFAFSLSTATDILSQLL
ncbi:MAG: zinc-ribbon domain-containing protein [Anaerolineales bacterium]|jgi:hypothetical protein